MKFAPIKYDPTVTGGITVLPPIIMPSHNWSIYLPTYEPQRFIYDLNICSQLGGCITLLEIYFNLFKATNKISPAFLTFLQQNGYFDSNGSFSFSERFTAIMDGTSINGNVMQNAWQCVQEFGLLPRSQLNWSLFNASLYSSQPAMDAAYYNPAVITQEMKDLAKAFLNFARVSWGWAADGTAPMTVAQMTLALQTSPIAFAGPVPTDESQWNQTNVPLPGNTKIVHCFCGYSIEEDGTIDIMDQYQPDDKRLAPGYPLSIGIIFHVELT